MQELEYLQLSINYGSSSARSTAFLHGETLKGFQDYLDTLGSQGWIMVQETQSDKGRIRTYYFRRTTEVE
jgi:hypothetical protein